LLDILKTFQYIAPQFKKYIRFSDIICKVLFVFDGKTDNLACQDNNYMLVSQYKKWNIYDKYIPASRYGKMNIFKFIYKSLKEYRNININILPLIEVAKYLNIKVEKSFKLRIAGQFLKKKNKIILCVDYAPVFIHELVHAIDYILGNPFEKYFIDHHARSYHELVAALSTFILCKSYNISIDIPHLLAYLNNYFNQEIDIPKIIERASLICNYVNICVEYINIKNIDAYRNNLL
jgi:hypothetical protein